VTEAELWSYREMKALLSTASLSRLILAGDPYNQPGSGDHPSEYAELQQGPFRELLAGGRDPAGLGSGMQGVNIIAPAPVNECVVETGIPGVSHRFRNLRTTPMIARGEGGLHREVWLNAALPNSGSWSGMDAELLDGAIEAALAAMPYKEQARAICCRRVAQVRPYHASACGRHA